jgi:hypothetical protein
VIAMIHREDSEIFGVAEASSASNSEASFGQSGSRSRTNPSPDPPRPAAWSSPRNRSPRRCSTQGPVTVFVPHYA